MEIQQAKERPDGHQHVCFCFDRIVRESAREQQEDRKGYQDKQTDAADSTISFASFLTRNFKDSNGSKAIDDGGTNCCGIHDPADRCSAEKRYRQRYKHDQKDGIDRNLFVTEQSVAFRQDAILSYGIAKTAQGSDHTDQTAEHQ